MRHSLLFPHSVIGWFFQCPAAKFIVPDWGNIVDSGLGLSYRPASLYVAWRAGTTTKIGGYEFVYCSSWMQDPSQLSEGVFRD
jgi:hypothetical protein